MSWEFPGGGSLDLLLAGRHNPDYATSVTGLNWDNFYNRLGGAQFFDALREDMKRHYDYALIDSRTGISDVAEICTIHLPDVLVDCFTLSDQGIDGARRWPPASATTRGVGRGGCCPCRCGSTTGRRASGTPGGRWPCRSSPACRAA